MLNLRYHVKKAQDKIKDTIDRVRDVSGPMAAGAGELRVFLRKWFDSEGKGSWKDHSSWTENNRKYRLGYYRSGGGGSRKLRWTGAMRRSIFQRGAKGHIERVTKKALVFGSEYTLDGKPLVLWHDLGKPSRFPLPARPIFPIDILFKVLTRKIHTQIQRSVGGFSPIGRRAKG